MHTGVRIRAGDYVESQLAERFQSLSAQALDASTRRFLEMAEGRLDAANAKAVFSVDSRQVENLRSEARIRQF